MATNPKISLVKGGKIVDGEFQANTGTQSETTYQAPNVSTLEKAPTPVSVPDSTTNVPDLPIYGFTQKTPEDVLKEQQLRAGQAGNAANLDSIYAGLLDIGTKGQFTQQAEEAAGIPQLNTQLTEIENELSQKSLGFRRERERILAAGGSKAQVDATLSEVGRKQNQELADLEVIRAARSNTLTNAQNLINRKVELEFGDKIAQVNALKFIYEENKDVLNKEDDRLFQKAIARESRAFEVAKQEYVQTETEKMRYVRNAAEAGASNETLKAIQGAKTLDDLYSLDGVQDYALSQAEILDIQAKRQSIYSSSVATRLALAEAGDPTAISELGFDPRKIAEAEPLDSTTKRQLEAEVSGSDALLNLLKEYRSTVQTYGYTNKIVGDPKVLGKVKSLRAQITDAYKEARTLGTLDTGVIQLVEGVIGEAPIGIVANFTGRKSRELVSSLDEVIETAEARRAKAQMRLGVDPIMEMQFSAEEDAALQAEFGQTTTTEAVFDPMNYYK